MLRAFRYADQHIVSFTDYSGFRKPFILTQNYSVATRSLDLSPINGDRRVTLLLSNSVVGRWLETKLQKPKRLDTLCIIVFWHRLPKLNRLHLFYFLKITHLI